MIICFSFIAWPNYFVTFKIFGNDRLRCTFCLREWFRCKSRYLEIIFMILDNAPQKRGDSLLKHFEIWYNASLNRFYSLFVQRTGKTETFFFILFQTREWLYSASLLFYKLCSLGLYANFNFNYNHCSKKCLI